MNFLFLNKTIKTMKSICSYLTENNTDLLEELRYARDKIHQIDSIINGVAESLKEYKDDLVEYHTQEIKELYKLQEDMEAIISDIYTIEGGRY